MPREVDTRLYAPESYLQASQEVRDQVCNGCGTSGWKGELVPDKILFLSITEDCDVHDWMYTVGRTLKDKAEADRVFLNNMLRTIEAAGGWKILKALRRAKAYEYYEAVSIFGGPAFWSGKNSAANLKETGNELLQLA